MSQYRHENGDEEQDLMDQREYIDFEPPPDINEEPSTQARNREKLAMQQVVLQYPDGSLSHGKLTLYICYFSFLMKFATMRFRAEITDQTRLSK